MPTNIFTKIDKDRMTSNSLTQRAEIPILDNSRAITQECLGDLAGYIELGRDIMPTNIFTKFDIKIG